MALLNRIVVISGMAISVCLAASAQSGSATAGAQAGASGSVQTSPQSVAVTDRYLTPVQTELTSRVDTRNAAVGQEVTARTKQAAKLADGTALPKGTKLVGKITQLQSADRASGRAGSMVTLSFDHAELKGGQTLQLRSVIQTVAPPAAVGASANTDTSSMAPMEPMGGGMSSSTGTRGGIGGVGGVGGVGAGGGTNVGLGGPGRQTGSLGGPVGQTTGSIGQPGGSIDQSADTIGQMPGTVGRQTGPIIGRSTTDLGAATGSAARTAERPVVKAGDTVSTGARATAMPGVMLSTANTAYSSGTLIAPARSITLESGTQITLGVIAR